ncbi:class I SAM-dependent methyltransferase [Pseudomonas nabeulensis]|uniref:Class I SAM-dependent methyltransferase n=1 Tax=Pseudomonas nabeulensis TaxID=2293833 RepID=A0A4Z0B324_9PSED|nr:class I SAM-dependent methyltransferase [Pseudomonas nabeulensis]TFY93472.1 class I SAM-dependent methyltransferase [Pseudomonas nabeulensis]
MNHQFDNLAKLYASMLDWPLRKHVEVPSVMRLIEKNLCDRDVLDYGCGPGIYTERLAKRGARKVLGYDTSEDMLTYARTHAAKKNLRITFTSTLGDNLNKQFDLVLAVYVMPYATTLHELTTMCAQMYNLLRPGGRLVSLPIHPHFHSDRNYYQNYGFRLSALNKSIPDREEGEELLLELFPPAFGNMINEHWEKSVIKEEIIAHYWSMTAMTDALTQAGFRSIKLYNHILDEQSDASLDRTFFQKYLDCPHAAILECLK